LAQQSKTITCPVCSNVNPYAQSECIKCGQPLGRIREAIEGRSSQQVDQPSTLTASKSEAVEAPVSTPVALWKGGGPIRRAGPWGDVGYLYAGKLTLVRGMGDQITQVRNLFLRQSEARGISGASYEPGQLEVDNQSRDYIFADRDLGSSAKATVAVRIDKIGTDLYIDWRHYVVPPREFNVGVFIVLFFLLLLPSCGVSAALTSDIGGGFTLGLIIAGIVAGLLASLYRAADLKGFQRQDSDGFQLAIRAAIDEAVDFAGISKDLRIETEYKPELPKKGGIRLI
jgi:hypothetical protein